MEKKTKNNEKEPVVIYPAELPGSILKNKETDEIRIIKDCYVSANQFIVEQEVLFCRENIENEGKVYRVSIPHPELLLKKWDILKNANEKTARLLYKRQ